MGRYGLWWWVYIEVSMNAFWGDLVNNQSLGILDLDFDSWVYGALYCICRLDLYISFHICVRQAPIN